MGSPHSPQTMVRITVALHALLCTGLVLDAFLASPYVAIGWAGIGAWALRRAYVSLGRYIGTLIRLERWP